MTPRAYVLLAPGSRRRCRRSCSSPSTGDTRSAGGPVHVEGIESVLEAWAYGSPSLPRLRLRRPRRVHGAHGEQGDEAGARRPPTSPHGGRGVRPRGGEPIKWLGDGVMLRFRDPGDAALAILELWRAPTMGLRPTRRGGRSAVFQDATTSGARWTWPPASPHVHQGPDPCERGGDAARGDVGAQLPGVRLPRAQGLRRPDAGVEAVRR